MVEVMKIRVTSFRRSHARTVHSVPPALQQDIINPRLRRRLLDTRTSLGQSLAGSLLLSPGSWYTQGSVGVLQESVNSVLGKFGGSVVGLMATSSKRDYAIPRGLMLCTQSPCPCNRPLLTHTFAGNTQTQFWLSLCGVSGSWCTQICFSPLSISGG